MAWLNEKIGFNCILNRSSWANFEDGHYPKRGVGKNEGSDPAFVRALSLVILIQASFCLHLIEIEQLNDAVDNARLLEGDSNQTMQTPPWYDYPQSPVWGQFGQNSAKVPVLIDHGPDGGARNGDPSAAERLRSINDPVIDWTFGSYSLGNDALSTPVASLHNQITVEAGAEERCGADSLFAFVVQTDDNGRSHIRAIDGDNAELAWEVDLGETELVKTSPVLTDIDNDGTIEVITAYDDDSGAFNLRLYSPSLECGLTGWSYGGDHSDEMLWSWFDSDMSISRPSPSPSVSISGHRPTTQVLLADVDFDGTDEALLALWDDSDEQIKVVAMDLTASAPSAPIWTATLDLGTHPSDPAYVRADPSTGFVLITTTDSSTGAVWLWKLDGSNGNEAWAPRSMGNTDGDSNVPHLRLPGPVLSNLDADSALEVIVTIPTDLGGTGNADGAEYRALEISDGQTELWSINAIDGYADAPPLPIDSDGDGLSDYVCWATWTMTSEGLTQERSGFAGCHDVNQTIPTLEWSQTLDLVNPDGVLNDEIAVAPPASMNIDGDGSPDILVAYGRGIHAFDGDSGSPSGVDSNWTQPVEVPHRTWSEIVFADLNGDASYDALVGSAAISQGHIDVRPLLDGRSIIFDPTEPDPGQDVVITAFFENSGNIQTQEGVDASLMADGVEIKRFRSEPLEPIPPSGTGSDVSFQAIWSGGLGTHSFQLVLDPGENISQNRNDNDAYEATLSIVPPYNATISAPSTPVRVDPGGSSDAKPVVISTGREDGVWSLSVDDDSLPVGWSWSDKTPGGSQGVLIQSGTPWIPILRVVAPASAGGDDEGHLGLRLTLDADPTVSVSGIIPVEANRTRGLSILGPEGLPVSEGLGFPGGDAMAWVLIENLGNAAENQVVQSWGSTEWGDDLRIYDPTSGEEIIGLTLPPNSAMEVYASLEIPNDALTGDNVSTILQLCVGQSQDQTCDDIELTFVAADVVVEPPHRRMVPGPTEYRISAKMPEDATSLNWSISDLGMSLPGWLWTSTDDNLSIDGDRLEITGAQGSHVDAVIVLEQTVSLQYIQPGFLSFEGESEGPAYSLMSFSIEILQQHNASLEMANENDAASQSLEIGDTFFSVLKMRNSGNGPDSYSVSWQAKFVDDIGSPNIEVALAQENAFLTPGELQTVPLSITLGEGTDAQRPIEVTITMSSLIDQQATDFVIYNVSALQDRQWAILSVESDGENLLGRRILIDPGSSTAIQVQVRNDGNYEDSLDLSIETSLDGTIVEGWLEGSAAVDEVPTGGKASFTSNLSIPNSLVNGSLVLINFTLVAGNGIEMGSTIVEYEITRKSAWGATFSETDLEIPAEGSDLEIDIVQLGNAPSSPYISTQIVGQKGWEVEPPNTDFEMAPGETRRVSVSVTPPGNAIHSLTVDLILRIRDADGSGLTEISIPVRVEATRSFTLDGDPNWMITEEGGYPLGWVQNTGNAATSINLSVIGLPEGWSQTGPPSIAVGSGESQGIPLSLIPPPDWDKSPFIVRIGAVNEANDQSEMMMTVTPSNHSWSSTPVSMITMGGSAVLKIHGTGPTNNVVDSQSEQSLQWDPLGFWILPERSGMQNIGYVTVDGTDILGYRVEIIDLTTRPTVCSLAGSYGSIDSLCVVGEGEDTLNIRGLLVDEDGDVVDAGNITIQSGQIGYLNLSYDPWTPPPGSNTISIRIYDEFGRILFVRNQVVEIRHPDYWNLGVVGLELEPATYDPATENQRIRVLISREGLQSYDDLTCTVTLKAPGIDDRTHIVDVAGTFGPEPLIQRPESLEDGVEISVLLACKFPWDQDFDSSDDLSRIILAGEAQTSTRSEDIRTGTIAAVFVIVIGGVLILNSRSRNQQKDLEEMARRIISEREERRRVADSKVTKRPKVAAIAEVEKTEKSIEERDPVAAPMPPRTRSDEDVDDFEMRLRRLGK